MGLWIAWERPPGSYLTSCSVTRDLFGQRGLPANSQVLRVWEMAALLQANSIGTDVDVTRRGNASFFCVPLFLFFPFLAAGLSSHLPLFSPSPSALS